VALLPRAPATRSTRSRTPWRAASWVALGCALLAASAGARGEGRTRWFMQKPAPATQRSKSVEERGVNPCNTPDPGFGSYDRWIPADGPGLILLPRRGGVSERGEFDVVFHFHGHDPARKEWVQAMSGVVFVGVTLGVGSGAYENAYRSPSAFTALLKDVEAKVAEKSGRKAARARRIGLSAWSAGYGAVEEILRQPFGRERVDSVILLDGLHCDYAGDGLVRRTLDPFVRFAKEAAANRRLMIVSHSSIIPPDYASTTETANFLVHELGGRSRAARSRASDPMGLELVSRYDAGNFHVRGYAGNRELDHCAQIGLFRDILKVHLAPRWKPARAGKK
jgi:hypothetical protein